MSLAYRVIERLSNLNRRVAIAESCTGGLLSAALTSIPGASRVFEYGYVTYSNQAKGSLFNIPLKAIETFGAVSIEVAQAMAFGALRRSKVDLALSITGIAGPQGGTEKKPVGLVHMALVLSPGQGVQNWCMIFPGDRTSIRMAATQKALQILLHA